ncbi:hypothetical protein [Kamptonema formosum]|uniref:hypothetical protein n=1 Tax=Kamptonema formosum TaxID=331992 RepID=UPI000346FE2C|nr:hypothetical protein [Oscillatoria sp. PCC 10802]
MAEEIYAPNIHLFACHAQKVFTAFTADAKPIDLAKDLLWEKYRALAQKLQIQPQDIPIKPGDFLATRADLLATKGKVLQPFAGKIDPNTNQPLAIKGFAYPVWLYDSYLLALNIRRPQEKGNDAVEITRLKDFNPDGCFLPSFIGSNLGQHLLLTAFLSQEQQEKYSKNLQQLADECYRSFTGIPSDPLPFKQTAQLFGSPIFEYSIPGEPGECEVTVWFFLTEIASEKFVDNYREFADLFFYRRKVLYSYYSGKADYETARKKCQDIEREIANLQQIPAQPALGSAELTDLKQKLKTLLQIALEYSQLLRNLEYARTTVEINGDNYEEKLKILAGELRKQYDIGGGELEYLERFSQLDCRKFQEQLQAYLNYLGHGSDLLDKAISTIRGLVEIDEAERDRQLEKTIQSLGVGIGAGVGVAGIIASSYQLIEQKPWQWPPSFSLPVHPFVAAVGWSVVAGAAVSVLGWLITKYILNSKTGKK